MIKLQKQIRILPHYHFCSPFILTHFVKEENRELHVILLRMRHDLVFMSLFYCIHRAEVPC